MCLILFCAQTYTEPRKRLHPALNLGLEYQSAKRHLKALLPLPSSPLRYINLSQPIDQLFNVTHRLVSIPARIHMKQKRPKPHFLLLHAPHKNYPAHHLNQ